MLPLIQKTFPPLNQKLEKKQRKDHIKELKEISNSHLKDIEGSFEVINEINFIEAIKVWVMELVMEETLQKREGKLWGEFKDLSEQIPHVDKLLTDCLAKIELMDPSRTVKSHSYPCPCKYHDAWQILLNQHLAVGCIWPSSSSFVSPASIMPKADPTALPCWVNNYRLLNVNMVIDSHPLPWVDDILNNCANGKFFSTINLTNSYF